MKVTLNDRIIHGVAKQVITIYIVDAEKLKETITEDLSHGPRAEDLRQILEDIDKSTGTTGKVQLIKRNGYNDYELKYYAEEN